MVFYSQRDTEAESRGAVRQTETHGDAAAGPRSSTEVRYVQYDHAVLFLRGIWSRSHSSFVFNSLGEMKRDTNETC